jgi:hypothetical protein
MSTDLNRNQSNCKDRPKIHPKLVEYIAHQVTNAEKFTKRIATADAAVVLKIMQ